jgi:hypothetical protein
MSDLLNECGDLIIAPGDLWDKRTILTVKLSHLDQTESTSYQHVVTEIRYMERLLRRIGLAKESKDTLNLCMLVYDLYNVNSRQWELEDAVRSDPSGKNALAARQNNSKRIAIKNEINQLYGYPVEVKYYKGEK